MDAIDRVLMNSRLHHLGMAARVAEPRLMLVILTCMDARIDPGRLLGLLPGDAHVIRNAGGRASQEAMDAIALSQALLGTREIMVIHHTDCAVGRFTQSELAARISAASGHAFHGHLDTFDDPIEAVLEDLTRLRAYDGLGHRDQIRGFLYDLSTDRLTEIAGP